MQLKKSFFNKTIFWKNIKSYWPVWAIFVLIAFIALPVASLMGNFSYSGSVPLNFRQTMQFYDITIGAGVSIVSMGFAVICAAAVFSYLSTHRSASFFHSLPVSREGLFITAYLSGFAFLAVPTIAAILLDVVVIAVKGGNIIVPALIGMGISLLTEFFFYTFAVLCMIFSGNAIGGFIFYGIMNGVFVFMVFIADELAQFFYFGHPYSVLSQELICWLCPVYGLSRVRAAYVYNIPDDIRFYSAEVVGIKFEDLRFLVYYAAIAVVFLVVSFIEYKRKNTESVGEVITVKWIKPFFKWGFTTCFMLLFTMLFYSIFFSGDTHVEWYMVISSVIFSIVGYIFSEMITRKSFKVLKTLRPTALIYVFLSALIIITMKFDLTGYEKRMPKSADEVTSVSLSVDGGTVIDNPLLINEIIAVHKDIVDNKEYIERETERIYKRQSDYYDASPDYYAVYDDGSQIVWDGDEIQSDCDTYAGGRVQNVVIEYRLASGKTLTRRYDLPFRSDRNDPSYIKKLNSIYNEPECVYSRCFRDADPDVFDIKYADILLYDENCLETTAVFSDAEAAGLLEAVKRDIAQGNMGRDIYDIYKESDTFYIEGINMHFLATKAQYENWELENGLVSRVPATVGSSKYYAGYDDGYELYVNIALSKNCANTIGFLKEHGAFDDGYSLFTEKEFGELSKKHYMY